MYGTTIRSFNENKDMKDKKRSKMKFFSGEANKKKEAKKLRKRDLDTQYMKLNNNVEQNPEDRATNESFSIKELPIASVVVTLVLTMMLLVMTSGFGGL